MKRKTKTRGRVPKGNPHRDPTPAVASTDCGFFFCHDRPAGKPARWIIVHWPTGTILGHTKSRENAASVCRRLNAAAAHPPPP